MNLTTAKPVSFNERPPAHQWRALDGNVFEVGQYDTAPPFSSFLPGVGGLLGAPLWCMYVNRGQAVCSFGYEDKDHAIAEFFSATWAYQLVGTYGFRTFLRHGDGSWHAPFSPHAPEGKHGQRTMRIEPHAVTIIDHNDEAGWRMEVSYTTIANSIVPALYRRVRLHNLTGRRRNATVADGLAAIVPAGVPDHSLKRLRRISEGFLRVALHHSGAALYYVPTSMRDEARIEAAEEKTFYGGWLLEDSRAIPMEMAVDPDAFFGFGSDLQTPGPFLDGSFAAEEQVWMNRLPCAIAMAEVSVDPGESVEWVAYSGFAPDADLLERFLEAFSPANVHHEAMTCSQLAVEEITLPGFAKTALKEVNGYVRQNFLDNLLRGGMPHLLPSRGGPRPVHVYSRRHGDLERDYNDFRLPAHPLSEGPGNFRDILQNRRYDSWFYPEAGPVEICAFAELIQADGYNPLSVEGYRWKLADPDAAAALVPLSDPCVRQEFADLVASPFSPGRLLFWLNKNINDSSHERDIFLRVLEQCDASLTARSDGEGYWIDHWVYLLDMLEAYEAIQPDAYAELLHRKVGWFEPGMRVLPRAERYTTTGGKLRQYRALGPRSGSDRMTPWPKVSVLAKLVLLVTVKAMTLDPEGRGVEMEAGRPGWNDALNGLPGLLGSGVGETAAMVRLARYLLHRPELLGDLEVPDPFADLIEGALPIAEASAYDWHASSALRESYRERVYAQNSVAMRTVGRDTVVRLLRAADALGSRGVEASRRPDSILIHGYFQRDGAWPSANGKHSADPTAISAKPLPLFLEAQVHLLRLACDRDEARAIYRAIRQSALRDEELGSYLLNEDLASCSQEIGRIRTFTRGIYENESIWLHMGYKLLVELLRHKLYEEFFEEAGTMLVPFMDPAKYGRSIYENSSYIASSICPDPRVRGRGFTARLSGAAAEFIHIWQVLAIGPQPFTVDEGGLVFELAPALPSEWFLNDGCTIQWQGRPESLPDCSLACCLFGKTLLVYQNPSLRSSWGDGAVRPEKMLLDGAECADGAIARGELAKAVRAGQFRRIDVLLGG